MKKITSLLLAAVLAGLSLTACGGKQAEQAEPEAPAAEVVETTYGTNKEGVFVLGLDDSFPPMGFRNEENEIVGFDIDIARAVCDNLGLELVLQPINWDTKEMELETGNIDVIWNALTVTPERKESMLLSKAYLNNNQVVCVAADSDIAAVADLAGKRVAVQMGSSADEALMKDPVSAEIAEKLEYDNNVSALLDLKIGGCDAVVLDEVVANYYAAKEPEAYKVLEDSMQPEEYAIAFKKGNTKLHDAVMAEYDKLAADGTLTKISEEWFGKDVTIK
ncbi:MAG: amino acid ABC transporter substrate-binding protein [Oscillospiraceae bacterium]|nr:amino acid ABC transporter substrate-binding protein [Oscillospiraceae bacterium]